MTYYKITNHAQGSFLISDFSVNYSIHHWVRGLGKLFVFDSIENVDKFRGPLWDKHRHYFPVWECEVLDPEPLPLMATNFSDFKRFWKSFPTMHLTVLTSKTPKGTIGVSTLKLLEQVC